MKLLITGGCGFLGSNLASDALKYCDELVIFDNLQRLGSLDNLLWLNSQGSFRFEHGDIRNQNDITRVIKFFHPDVIFHLAGQVAMTTSITNPKLDFEVNAQGTHNLLEAVRQHSPDTKIVYSSTNKVYGSLEEYNYDETDTRFICREHPAGFDENTPLNFQSPYGCSKGTADQYMLDYARIFGLKTLVFRHSSLYGGRQFSTYDQGWIGWFCKKGIDISLGVSREPIEISGNGKQVRDVLHVDDVKDLYRAAINSGDCVYGQAYNIGGGYANSLSLLELFSTIAKILKIKIEFTSLPVRASDQKVFIANMEKVNKYLGWKPRISLDAGILKMLEWTKERHNIED